MIQKFLTLKTNWIFVQNLGTDFHNLTNKSPKIITNIHENRTYSGQ